jgi:hypothetical protein
MDAVATADRFSAALSSGDLVKAGKELDPDVLILESGGAERKRVAPAEGRRASNGAQHRDHAAAAQCVGLENCAHPLVVPEEKPVFGALTRRQ